MQDSSSRPSSGQDVAVRLPTLVIFENPGKMSPAEEGFLLDDAGLEKTQEQGIPIPDRPERIGEFTIVREIGRGGMGVVYEALQESLQRRVALKILPLTGRMDKRQILRFQNEARAAAQLNHPSIVPVHSIGTEAGFHYYAMQMIDGRDLAHHIRHAKSLVESRVMQRSAETPSHRTGTTLKTPISSQKIEDEHAAGTRESSPEISAASFPSAEFISMMADRKPSVSDRKALASVVSIGIQAAEALHHAHLTGVVHRDIKPSNLLLENTGKLWVTDFGLAQIQGAGALTMTGEVIGTLRYMSPEQPLGQRVLVDQRTDIYSLGITLYELLTLHKAYQGETPKEIIRQVCFDEPISIRRLNRGIPEDLETIVLKATSKNPDDRYQTAQELADDLRRFQDDLPILARRPTLIQRFRRLVRRHAALATAIAFGGMIIFFSTLIASGMIWRSLNAEIIQRKRVKSLLDKSEGLRLIANAALTKDVNPGLAVLLAERGAQLSPGVDANSALLTTMGLNHEVRTFSPRSEVSETIAVSPDGQRMVTTALQDFSGKSAPAIESDIESGVTVHLFDDGSAVTSAAYSSDGRFLLTTSQSGDKSALANSAAGAPLSRSPGITTLWDAQTGTRRHAFHDSRFIKVSATLFSPDSDRIVLPGPDNTVRIFSAQDGSLQNSLAGHTDEVVLTTFGADGKMVASAGKDNTVRVWDVASGREVQKFAVQWDAEEPMAIAFAKGSDYLVISTADGTRLVSMGTGENVNSSHWPESEFRLSQDGGLLALFFKFDRQVTVRDLRSLSRTTVVRTPDRILSADLSDDGRLLLVTTAKEGLLFGTEDGSLVASLKGHTDRVLDGRFIKGSERAVTTSIDGTVRCWNVRNGNSRFQLHPQPAQISPSPWSFSSDSTHAIVASKAVWQSELINSDGTRGTSRFPGFANENVVHVNHLITADERNVYVTEGNSLRRIGLLHNATDRIQDVKAVTGTSEIVVLLDSGKVILWDMTTNRRSDLGDPEETVLSIDVHPASRRIALGSEAGSCVVYDVNTRGIVRQLTHEQQAVFVRFDRSGTRLLTVDSGDTTRLWSLDQEMPLLTLHETGAMCDRAVFSGDETHILTLCHLKTDHVRCWQTDTGQKTGQTPLIEGADVCCHATQPLAAIASVRNGLLLWNLETGQQRQLAESAAMSPVLLMDRLISVEADPNFRVPDSVRSGWRGVPEFVRASIVTRDLASGERISVQSVPGEPGKLSFNSETGQILSSFRTFSADVIQMADHRKLTSIGQHSGPITFSSLSGSGNSIRAVCTSLDGTISISDLSGRLLHRLQGSPDPILNVSVSGDGQRLATFHANGAGEIWDLAEGIRIAEFPAAPAPMQSVAFSRSGNQLLLAGGTASVTIRDLLNRTEKAIPLEFPVRYASWKHDEKQLLIIYQITAKNQKPAVNPAPSDDLSGRAVDSTRNSNALLLEIDSGNQIPLSVKHPVKSGCLSPDGTHAALLQNNGALTLCRTDNGNARSDFNANRRPVYNAAFSPDSQELLVQHDGELSLWEVATGIEVLRIPDAGRQYWGVAMQTSADWTPFTPDGQWMISAVPEMQKWPRDPLAEAARRVPRQMTSAERLRFSVDLISNASENPD